jgi:predicted metalloprotease
VRSKRHLFLLTVVILSLSVTGCSQVVQGEAVAARDEVAVPAADQQPGGRPRGALDAGLLPVLGATDSADDRFATRVVTGIDRYWRATFPAEFGAPWRPLNGFVAANPNEAANPAPCLSRALDLTDQALYCPRLDTVAWDRTTLVPNLRTEYGDSAVIMALAHEIGHAVQARAGIDTAAQQREPDRYPTILLEGMADCLSGSTLRAVANGRIAGLRTDPAALDRALHGLVSFRDPVGRATVHGAHGNGFDRASAFIGGYDDGPDSCLRMTVEETTFTQQPYRSVADKGRGGNLSLTALLAQLEPDVAGWFDRLSAARGYPKAHLLRPEAGPDVPARPDRVQLAATVRSYGDYAAATVLTSRYALAYLAAMDRPTVGPDAARAATCLTGAYTASLFVGATDFRLSPGDLDEAVDELLSEDLAARDADGRAAPGDHGFDRVRQFRAGMLNGAAACD